MLNASKLKSFLELAKQNVPELKQTFRVIQDEDVANFTREVTSSGGNIVLIGVLPSVALDFKNLDNFRHRNKMQFFILKKYDVKGSEEDLMQLFDDTAAVVLKFEAWMFLESDKFPCPPIFKSIKFETFSADPVSNYFGFCGYMIQFDLKTK
jgi:hypothetical protein